MRLIRISSKLEISLDPDLDHGSVPDYAILSHTWGLPVEELRFQDLREKAVLTFEDLRKSRPLSKPGIEKLIFCALQAHDDGIQHIWIDTCCINKFDKQENAEAVKDMFRWYQKAKKCYVYLSDVPKVAFAKSRWFTRGWTLQELLAPKTVEFFTCTGDYLGNKETLLDDLHRITGIPTEALGGQLPLSEFSVSERFGWGVRRVTTREEDQVYCLLGIFEVDLDMSLQGLDGAYANLLDAIDTSTQPHYDRSAWPCSEFALGRHAALAHKSNSNARSTTMRSRLRQAYWVLFRPNGGSGDGLLDSPLGPLVKLIRIAVFLMEHSKFDDVEDLLKLGLDYVEELERRGDIAPSTLTLYTRFLYSRLGTVYWELQHYDKAVAMYELAVQGLNQVAEHRSFWYETECNLGNVYMKIGREDQARASFQKAVDGRRQLFRDNTNITTGIWLARALVNLGSFHRHQKNLPEAVDHLNEGLRVVERQILNLRPDWELAIGAQTCVCNAWLLWWVWMWLSLWWWLRGKITATRAETRALRLEELNLRANLGRVYMEEARGAKTKARTPNGAAASNQLYADAVAAYSAAIRAWETTSGGGGDAVSEQQRTHPQYLLALQSLGNLYQELRNGAQAIQCLTKAFEGHLRTGHVYLYGATDALARSFARQGLLGNALGVIDEVCALLTDGDAVREERKAQLGKLRKEIVDKTRLLERQADNFITVISGPLNGPVDGGAEVVTTWDYPYFL